VIVYSLHRDQHVSFHLASLTLSQLALPAIYVAVATVILVAYLAGFLLVAFHPDGWPCTTSWRAQRFASSTAASEQVVEAVKATTFTRRPR